MKKTIIIFLSSMFFMLPAFAATQATAPVQMLETVSNVLLKQLQKEKALISNNPKRVYALAKKIILPHIDVNGMAKMALGRTNWRSAKTGQRSDFIKFFTDMMIRTYSSALAAYTDEKIIFYPIRGGVRNDQRLVNVNSIITQAGGPSIPVSYRLVKRGKAWKIYDFSVDGVSLVQSFRSQFSAEISRGGISSLISRMKKHVEKGIKK